MKHAQPVWIGLLKIPPQVCDNNLHSIIDNLHNFRRRRAILIGGHTVARVLHSIETASPSAGRQRDLKSFAHRGGAPCCSRWLESRRFEHGVAHRRCGRADGTPICPKMSEQRKCLAPARNDAIDLGCVKTRKIEKSRECFFLDQLKPDSLGNVCATIGDLDERFFCRYRARLSFYTAKTPS